MTSHRRRQPLGRRRRHDDEGEEDGSVAGELAIDSSDDGSLSSGLEAHDDLSEGSADVVHQQPKESSIAQGREAPKSAQTPELQPSSEQFRTSADTDAMLNGLTADHINAGETLDFDTATQQTPVDPKQKPGHTAARQPSVASNPPFQQNPAFVPNRGGFFLHDVRTRDLPTQPAAYRGRGRGYFPGMHRPGYFNDPAPRAEKQWAHDLHESVNGHEPIPPTAPLTHMTKPTTGPKRSFSTTTVLGNVVVQVSFPGMSDERKVLKQMVKTHYTLLPEHRPPLRRDKPVRVSVPQEHPRYIFPSTDRSFIFIPRALRPNQQAFRGRRGRGSLGGSRRTSIYGGSNYAPSVAMSRKSSFAGSGSGVHTPTGPPQMPPYMTSMHRPVVRMPMGGLPAYSNTIPPNEPYPTDIPAIIHSPSATLPMHQPQPTKPVSPDDLTHSIKQPQQQSEQPFHQQVPQSAVFDAQSQANPAASLTHIPEGAVYAQPFQPYPVMPSQDYYGTAYPPAMMMGGDTAYGMQAQAFVPSQPDGPMPMAHESNGMVYYYPNPQQHLPNYPVQMMPPGSFYYQPQGPMFYQ